jgi:hypothetical protein
VLLWEASHLFLGANIAFGAFGAALVLYIMDYWEQEMGTICPSDREA